MFGDALKQALAGGQQGQQQAQQVQQQADPMAQINAKLDQILALLQNGTATQSQQQ